MKKLILLWALMILLAFSVFGDNSSLCSGVDTIYWCDEFNARASWTDYQNSFSIVNFDGENRFKSDVAAANQVYLNSVVSTLANQEVSVRVLMYLTTTNYGYFYGSKDGQFSVGANSFWNYFVSDTAGNDLNLRNFNTGPLSVDTDDIPANKWVEYCWTMNPTFSETYINGTFEGNQSFAAVDISLITDIGFRSDTLNNYIDELVIYKGDCLNIPVFDAGPPAPIVTITDPQQSHQYNSSFNGSIVLTTDITANCSINYTNTKISKPKCAIS